LRFRRAPGSSRLPPPPDRFGSRFDLSWSWLPSEVCPTINRPVCWADLPPTREGHGQRPSCAGVLAPQTGSLEVLPPFSATLPGRADQLAGLPPPPAPSSGFLDLLTVFAAPGPRGLVSCRLRSWDSPFRAFPFQESVPLSGPMLPCGWVSTFCSGHLSPDPIPIDHLRARWGWSPSRGASSFIVSPTTFSEGQPLASSAPHPRSASPPTSLTLSSSRVGTKRPAAWNRAVNPGFLLECGAPPLRSLAPPGSPFASPSGCPA
jgi:hypothetical protein